MTDAITDLTFAELRLASALHRIPAVDAAAELTELVRTLVPPQTLDRFMRGEPIDADVRLIRQQGGGAQLAHTLAGMVIQVDEFAALNGIDLAAAIRARFKPDIVLHSVT